VNRKEELEGAERERTARLAGCGQAGDGKGEWRTLKTAGPKRWAEVRNRGLEKATKSGVSFRYLGLRVAPTEAGVNPGVVNIDEECYSGGSGI
jgi:hypothetical protein